MRLLTDHKLIKAIKSNQPKKQNEAFIILHRRCFRYVKNYIINNQGDEAAAADIFQDSYIILLNQFKKPEFQISSSLTNYLRGICRKLWLIELRKKKNRAIQLWENLESMHSIEEHIPLYEIRERNQVIMTLLKSLNDDCRKVIQLFYYYEMKMAQIKEAMGFASEQVAKNKKSHCLKKLREIVRGNPQYLETLR